MYFKGVTKADFFYNLSGLSIFVKKIDGYRSCAAEISDLIWEEKAREAKIVNV